ncbi:unnamed protein product, partial [Timema podura]|nr:unnamed protein product [Timema podura]
MFRQLSMKVTKMNQTKKNCARKKEKSSECLPRYEKELMLIKIELKVALLASKLYLECHGALQVPSLLERRSRGDQFGNPRAVPDNCAVTIQIERGSLRQRMNDHRFDTNYKDPDKAVPIHAGTHNQDFQTCYTTNILRAFPKHVLLFILDTHICTSYDNVLMMRRLHLEELYPHMQGGRVEKHLGGTTLGTSDQDSNPNLPIIGSPVYCESNALDHSTIEACLGDLINSSGVLPGTLYY